MAKNFVHKDGDQIEVVAPGGGVTSGGVVVIGDLIGVALISAAAGELFTMKLNGVFNAVKDTGDSFAVGDLVDWDGAKAVAAAAGNKLGIVVEAVGTGVVLVKVKLNATVA